MMRIRRTFAVAVGLTVALGVSGCQWDGLNSLPMPGTEGTAPGSYHVRIQMPNVTTLTRNSPVRVHDVTVGTVSGIEVEDWHALVTVTLNPDVRLPANAVAKIGQTSLLGSNHLELSAPTDQPPEGELKPGMSFRWRGPGPTRPPSRCCPRCRWCSTAAASRSWKPSPANSIPRSPGGRRRSGTCCRS